MRRWVPGLLGAAVLGAAVLALPALRAALSADSIAAAAAALRGFGVWAPLASLALMVLQAVVAPVPGSLLVAANGVIFGLGWGALLSWAGGLLGASASFWIARRFGQAAVARLGGAAGAAWLERISRPDSFWFLLAARLIPLLSFDAISYLAGLSGMSYPRFLLATAVGMLPGTLAWTALGHDLALARQATWRLGAAGLLALAGLLAARWWLRRQAPDGPMHCVHIDEDAP